MVSTLVLTCASRAKLAGKNLKISKSDVRVFSLRCIEVKIEKILKPHSAGSRARHGVDVL